MTTPVVQQKQESAQTDLERKPPGWGKRHTFALLSFLGFANVFAMRVNLSVTIVKMVSQNISVALHQNSSFEGQTGCQIPNTSADNDIPTPSAQLVESRGDFEWSAKEQGQILGSLFYGNIISQIPAGILAEAMGGKHIFGIGVLVSSLVTLLTPFLVLQGTWCFILSRAVIGFAQGVTFPTMYVLISEWIPPRERPILSVFIWSGIQFGTCLALPLSGYLSEWLNWQAVFYVTGTCGLLWFGFFTYFVTSKPSQDKTISIDELFYIETSLPVKFESKDFKMPPFKDMFLSLPVWALMLAHMGNNWGMYTLLTEMPTYLTSVHHFDISSSGLLSALPYFLMWTFSIFCGLVASRLRSREVRSDVIRKSFNTIGHLGPALALIGLSFSGCNRSLVIFWFCLAVMLNGAANSGFQVNHVELSPKFAGTLMGITNTAANMAGFAAPQLTGVVIHENPTLGAWRTVFLIAACIYVIDSVIFAVFGSSKTRKWNEQQKEENDSGFHFVV